MRRRIVKAHHSQILLAIIAAICLVPILTGCSVVGFAVGTAIDGSHPKYSAVEDGKLDDVKDGKQVIVKLDDSTEIAGKFGGNSLTDDSIYIRTYTQARTEIASQLILPGIGDTVAFSYPSGAMLSGTLVGFQQKFPSSPCSTYVVLNSAGNGVKTQERLKYLPFLYRSKSDSLETSKICDLIAERKIPLMSQLTVIDSIGYKDIPMERVTEVQVKNKRSAKWIGLGIGLGVDAAMVAFLIALSNMTLVGGEW